MPNNTNNPLWQFDLKDGRTIFIDFLSVESLMAHQSDMKEVREQLEIEWPKQLKENISKTRQLLTF